MKNTNTLKVLAVIVAIIIWFVINLLKEHTTMINHPIRIVNVPSNLYLFENEEISLPVMVSGTGINILLYYLTTPSIDYNGSDIVMGSNLLDMERLNSSLLHHVSLSFSIIPIENSFVVNTDRILQKRVPVLFDFFSDSDKEILLENDYNFDDIFVTLSGPSIELQRIDHAFTEKISSDILQRRRRNVHLKPINEHIVIMPAFIELTQASEVTSTRTIPFIPIKYDDSFLSIFPDRVSVIIEAKQDSLNMVTADDITAYILDYDVRDVTELNIYFMKPDFVRIVDFTPSKVSARRLINN